ncbi:pickpocket protein 28-like [Sitodiplosis mosellana]|uniref:pickpocket protein 28-like n=1 Tax=Sitodiplosis mosellana TaxID=263140 RepID=UPI0024440C13|nr:pickpocket protein 28-like [Sitodiplosis mosellana]
MAPGMMIVNTNPNVSNWSLEGGYKNLFGYGIEYPNRGYSGDPAKFLISFFIYNREFEYFGNAYQGFKVALTIPGETWTMSRNFFRVPISEDTRIMIKPKMITTSDGLRRYEPYQRDCFYQLERRLRFFKLYTQINCEEECRANFTKMECECVKFSMPRDINTKICGVASINCYQAARRKLAAVESGKRFREKCNCMPACTSIEYKAEIDRSNFGIVATVPKGQGVHLAILAVWIKSSDVDIVKRVETYTFSDFLAICGGLLGLFLGMSALSIIELVYFFTLHWFWTIRRLRSDYSNKITQLKCLKNITIRFAQPIKTLFFELCDNSNIHGVRYLSERLLHWSERCWWLIFVGLSLWICGSMIQNIWIQWDENPVSMQFTSSEISAIPFPTVTICPEIKTNKQKFDVDAAIKSLATLSHNEYFLPYLDTFSSTLISVPPVFTDKFYLVVWPMFVQIFIMISE